MELKEILAKIKSGEAKPLTLESAKALKGKKIAWTYFGYKGNQNTVCEMIVGNIISSFDYEKTQPDPNKKFASQADYWLSYMTEKQIDCQKTDLLLLNADKSNPYIVCHTKYYNFFPEPTFTCSDADRCVFYLELD